MSAANKHIFHIPLSINCKGKLLSLQRPLLMGILNITPDSFYEGSRIYSVDEAVKRALKMLKEGAAMIDIGGYSTRPGADEITADEEIQRVVPVIEGILKVAPEAIISIDTFRAAVAKAAVSAGAAIINDISAGDDDPEMVAAAANYSVPYIAMHKQGAPRTMQHNPQYTDVVLDIIDYFATRIRQYTEAGIKDMLIDPGFGFGKTIAHNYTLLKRLNEFDILGKPMLVGVSRKSMAYRYLGIAPDEALNATTALHMLALQQGARILRVHDIKPAAEAVKIFEAYDGIVAL